MGLHLRSRANAEEIADDDLAFGDGTDDDVGDGTDDDVGAGMDADG